MTGTRLETLHRQRVDTIVLNPLDWGVEQLERPAGEVLPRMKTVR